MKQTGACGGLTHGAQKREYGEEHGGDLLKVPGAAQEGGLRPSVSCCWSRTRKAKGGWLIQGDAWFPS